MVLALIVFAIIIFTCIFLNNLSSKMGVPVLLLFIVFGLIAGLPYESVMDKYSGFIGDICTAALIFVMFYGGFGTKWSSSKTVVVEAGLLASLGVVMTAAAVGIFCHFALKWNTIESFLMGAVICSTDAATVFSILRTHNLGLKKNLAPLLEIESGSNDPCSYMLTAIFISIMNGSASGGFIVWTIFAQIFFGALCGAIIAQCGAYVLRRYHFTHSGFDSLFILAVAIISYAIPAALGGNGYLSAYIVGIVLGNINFHGRKPLIPFFDAVTDLMQIVIFFLLGFMAIGSHLLKVIPVAIIIFLFLLLVARPIAVFSILSPFKKYSAKMMAFTSFVGLRGAASIVFAIMTVAKDVHMEHDIFSIVFVIVLISIAGQGSLIPKMSEWLKVTSPENDDLKTFSDFSENDELSFGKVVIKENSSWKDKQIKELTLPKDLLIVRVQRGKNMLVPDGKLTLELNDTVILCTRSFTDPVNAKVRSHPIGSKSKWVGVNMRNYYKEKNVLAIMIKRGNECIIPDGHTVIKAGDIIMTEERG